MKLSLRRRRWIWPMGLLAGLVAVTVLAALFIDEPARRYMERRSITGSRIYRDRARPSHPP